jgi:hypothetical protein
MFNVVDGEVTATELVVADGVARPVTAEGCSGTERVEFSESGVRAYTRSEFQCEGESRSGSGVMSFVSPSEWIDVRSLTVAGEPVAWAQHYELASALSIESQGIEDPAGPDQGLERAARLRASRGIEIADVEEVAPRIDTRALEVWVAAHETAFELSGSELVRLADAGLPESVIDVMVAVSYPERFRISPEGAPDEAERTVSAPYPAEYRRGYRSYLFDPFFYRPFGYRLGYSRFGYYGYDGFGYGGYWGYVPATIVVQPAQPSIIERVGRMIPGRGYTRDGSSGGGSSGGSSGGAQPSRSSDNGAGGGSSSGGSSSGGSSSGGGGTSTGRRAQPRN